jgi:TetR/AcrR family transcriptional regulator of autoinduction and epiphytic fitness
MREYRRSGADIEQLRAAVLVSGHCTRRETTSTVRAVTQTVDGRTARSARTRAAVVTAVLELVRAGNPRPTAKEIAARAGISLRSVYVHFEDLDDLFAAASARQAEEVAHLLYPVDAGLPRAARIAEVVHQRGEIWETLAPIRRAVLVWESSSPTLREGAQRSTKRAGKDLARVFATELGELDPDRRALVLEALHLVCSAGAWEVLRRERGLSVDDAEHVVGMSLTALLDPPR